MLKYAVYKAASFQSCLGRVKFEGKDDMYDFGVILLEIILGKQLKSRSEVNSFKDQVTTGITLYLFTLHLCLITLFHGI